MTPSRATPKYPCSYTMTSYDLQNGENVGMTSIFSSNVRAPSRQSSIRNPANKLMLAEEVTNSTLNDNPVPGTYTSAINDGRNVPSKNVLPARHNKKEDVGLADGHVQPVDWKFGLQPENSRPDLWASRGRVMPALGSHGGVE